MKAPPELRTKVVDSRMMQDYMTRLHYLHRPVIRTKTLCYGVYRYGRLVGGVTWATPHFTKKRGLFGFDGLLDKWEVLVLARFYLMEEANLWASAVLSEIIGRAGRRVVTKRRGWRVQRDWVEKNPPVFRDEPFVPRLLISWSDIALERVKRCSTCGGSHSGNHQGYIYQASGWTAFDETQSSGRRTGANTQDGLKRCWILPLSPNPRLEARFR